MYTIEEVTVSKNPDVFGNYTFLYFINDGSGNSKQKNFKTKAQAIKFAKQYMKKH